MGSAPGIFPCFCGLFILAAWFTLPANADHVHIHRHVRSRPAHLTVPDAPGIPQLESVTSRTIKLSWRAPRTTYGASGVLPGTVLYYLLSLQEHGSSHGSRSRSRVLLQNGRPEWETNALDSGYDEEGDNRFTGVAPPRRIRTPDNSTTFTVTNLRPSTAYAFQLIAVNSKGHSRPSEISPRYHTKAEPQPPGTPVLVLASNESSTSIRLQWLAPSSEFNPRGVRGYRLTYRQALPSVVVITSPEEAFDSDTNPDESRVGAAPSTEVHEVVIENPHVQTYEIRRLQPHQRYYISLQAYNEDGYSSAFTEVIWTAEGHPGPPRDLHCDEVTDTTIVVSWLPPASPNGVIRGYNLHWTHPAGYTDSVVIATPWRSPGAHSAKSVQDGNRALQRVTHRLSNLSPSSLYYVQVNCFTSKGPGPLTTQGLPVWTDVTSPIAPEIHSLTRVADNALLAQWWMPPEHAGKTTAAKEVSAVTRPLKGNAGRLVKFHVKYRYMPESAGPGRQWSSPSTIEVFVEPSLSSGLRSAEKSLSPNETKSKKSSLISVENSRAGTAPLLENVSENPVDCLSVFAFPFPRSEQENLDPARCIIEAVIGNLSRHGLYEVRVKASKRSAVDPGKLLEGPYSSPATYLMESTAASSADQAPSTRAGEMYNSEKADLTATEVGLIVGIMLVLGLMLIFCALYCVFRKRIPLPGYTYLQLPSNGHGHTNGTCAKPISAAAFRNSKTEWIGSDVNSKSRILVTELSTRIKSLYADGLIGLSREYESIAAALTHSGATQNGTLPPNATPGTGHFAPTYQEALRLENRPKNRYVNVFPYDHTRVKLKTVWNPATVKAETEVAGNQGEAGESVVESEDGDAVSSCCPSSFAGTGSKSHPPSSDYINASFVDGIHAPAAYILTQAPLEATFADFWAMVWDYDVQVLVMVTRLFEDNLRKKADMYWPSFKNAPISYGPFKVTLTSENITAFYTVRTFTLVYLNGGKTGGNHAEKVSLMERNVMQFLYEDWPDHGRPEFTVPLLRFIMKSARAFEEEGSGPPVVHCSAGIGRSGSYIAVHSLMLEMDRTGHVDVVSYLICARKQRPGLVQTEDQYSFIYDALLEYMQSGQTEVYVASFDEYLDALLKDSRHALIQQHSLIADRVSRISSQPALSFDIAHQSFNRSKNRSFKYLPTDTYKHRVILTPKPAVAGSDYINASFLPGYRRMRQFIITQQPMEETVASFWQMIWDFKVKTVLLILDGSDDRHFVPPSESPLTFDSLRIEQIPSVPLIPAETTPLDPTSTWTPRTIFLRLSHSTVEDNHLCHIIPVKLPVVNENDKEWLELLAEVEKAVVNNEGAEDGSKGKAPAPVVVMDEFGGPDAVLLCGVLAVSQQALTEASVDLYQTARVYNQIRPGVLDDLATYEVFHHAARSICRAATARLPVANMFLAPGGTLQATPPSTLSLSLSKRLSAILEEDVPA